MITKAMRRPRIRMNHRQIQKSNQGPRHITINQTLNDSENTDSLLTYSMTNTEPITEAPPNPLKRHSTEDVVADKRLKLLTDINTDTSSKSVAAASVLRASPHSKQLHRFRSLSEILRQLISSALHSSVDHVLKALAASVMTKAFNTCSTLESDADEISCNGNKNSATTSSLYEYRAAEMAREKAAECIRLQRVSFNVT